MEKSIRMLNQRVEDKDVGISVDIDHRYSVMVDRPSFSSSVLNNLLSNAIKFSPKKGRIEIEAKKKKNKIILTIRDYGNGIPADLLADIFDPSKPTSRPGTDGETGTGFGMPLVHRFMQRYNGTIEIESEVMTEDSKNHGTLIKLTLNSA